MKNENYTKFHLFTVFVCTSAMHAVELKGLKLLINFISGEFMETKREDGNVNDEVLPNNYISKGYSNYDYLDFITYKDLRQCLPHEYPNLLRHQQELLDGATSTSTKKAPIKVRCLPDRGNGTLQIINSLKEVVTMLAPHGNNTKRTAEGNCALVLFYAKTCPISAVVAPHFNAVSKLFPDIRIGAIDAFRFHGLNTDFGIIGLPTIMLFHQGRPVVKFNDTPPTVNCFASFVTKHTGLEPTTNNMYVTSEDFHGPLSNKVEIETDYCLYLAWSFIMVCSCYYFTKSKLYIQIIETIKRNWRESEAQHEHNI